MSEQSNIQDSEATPISKQEYERLTELVAGYKFLLKRVQNGIQEAARRQDWEYLRDIGGIAPGPTAFNADDENYVQSVGRDVITASK